MALAQTLAHVVQTYGNAGAVANAYRACEGEKLTLARIDALAASLRPRADLASRAPVERARLVRS